MNTRHPSWRCAGARRQPGRRDRAGMALLSVMSFMAVVMIICGALLTITKSHMQSMRSMWESDRCFLAA